MFLCPSFNVQFLEKGEKSVWCHKAINIIKYSWSRIFWNIQVHSGTIGKPGRGVGGDFVCMISKRCFLLRTKDFLKRSLWSFFYQKGFHGAANKHDTIGYNHMTSERHDAKLLVLRPSSKASQFIHPGNAWDGCYSSVLCTYVNSVVLNCEKFSILIEYQRFRSCILSVAFRCPVNQLRARWRLLLMIYLH